MAEKEKIRVNVKDIVRDIRTGMIENELMDKYGLSSRGLQSAFRKLVAIKAISSDEMCSRSPGHEDTCEVIDSRMMERNYVVFELPVVQVDDGNNSGWIRDLTEKGFKVSGLKAKQGVVMELLIVPHGLDGFEPIGVDARCQWVSDHGSSGRILAGFRITNISPENRVQLSNLIQFMTIVL